MLKDNLKRLRQAAGFTQAGLAEATSVPLRTVQNWEQGHREPGIPSLKRLAEVLGVSLDDLLAEPPAVPKKVKSDAWTPDTTSADRPARGKGKPSQATAPQVEGDEPAAKKGRRKK